jgi:hypothetical protein
VTRIPILIAALLVCGQAEAQTQRPARPAPTEQAAPKGPFPLPFTPPGPNNPNGPTGDPIADLRAVVMKLGDKIIVHLKQAYALASAPDANSPGGVVDQTSAQCTKALVPIMQLVVNGPPSGTVPATDPMALTTDEQAIASNTSEPEGVPVQIEKLRILRLSLEGPALNLACGALVQDEVKNAQALVGKITSLITGAGLAGITIP